MPWSDSHGVHFCTYRRLHPRRLAKWAIYAAASFALANVFLAYFVGVSRLRLWVLASPLDCLGTLTPSAAARARTA